MKKTKCLNPNCKSKAFCRGLCSSCYSGAARLVSKGLVTWKILVSTGKCTEALHQHNKVKAWLLSWKSK